MVKKKFMVKAISVMIAGVIVAGCNQVVSVNDESSETSAALFKISAVANSPFTKLARKASLTISSSDMNSMVRELMITSTGIEGTVTGIPSGKARQFSVMVYDSLDTLHYRGSAVADLPRGATVSVPINIYRVTSTAVINGSVIENDTSVTLNTGLVAWYPLNGTALDMSGNLNNGTVFGATVTDDKNGRAQSAYQFDGVDDYIEVPYSSSLDCEDRLSITAWAKSEIPGEQYADGALIVQMGFGSEEAYAMILNPNIDRMQFYFCHHWKEPTDASLTPLQQYDTQIIDGSVRAAVNLDTSWHYYALTFDGDSLRGYIDNTYIGSYKTIPGPITNNLPLRIGAQSKSLARYWKGKIDDLRIYHRALSVEEISEISLMNDYYVGQ